MKILSGEDVRRIHQLEGSTSISVDGDIFVTRQAADYMKAHGLVLKERSTALEQTVKPEQNVKPEHMTHLYGTVLVRKDHQRILFRGKLDSLQAKILEIQMEARKSGSLSTVEELQSMLGYCRTILGSEVSGKPLGRMDLLGLDEKQLREMSQHPKTHFGVDHVMPSIDMGEIYIKLNSLRTAVRETELAAVAAFCRDGTVEREDILKALNRLSSGVYIMMCKELEHSYVKSQGNRIERHG